MPYSVKGFFEINDDIVQILLMFEVLFTQDSKVEDLLCGASSGSEPSLSFSNYFFSLGFKPVQDDFQHDCARMTDKADSSVVLAELQVALFRECNNQRLSPWGRPFTYSPDSVCRGVLQFGLQSFTSFGWSGGAKVLGKLPVPGRPTNLDYS